MRTHGAVVGRRFRSVTKLTTKVRIGRGYLYVWGSFLIASAALKTPTRNGYNAQGVNLKLRTFSWHIQAMPGGIRAAYSYLAFTRYCHCQCCLVYGMHTERRVKVVYCAVVMQQYCNSVSNADGGGNRRMID